MRRARSAAGRAVARGGTASVAVAIAIMAVLVSPGAASTSAAAPETTTAPSISGPAVAGGVLTASSGSWSGDTPMTFAYAWQSCDSGGGGCLANGSAGQTYTVAPGDVGHTLRVEVSATNATGTGAALSAKTAIVDAATPPANTSLPSIAGTAQHGSALTTSDGTWTGAPPPTIGYGWQRCNSSGGSCTSISGQSSRTYVVGSTDVGGTIRAVVTATNAGGRASATSNPTSVVTSRGDMPQPTSQPDVTGTPQVGKTLTAGLGSAWKGTTPITYSFSWQRCSSPAGCSTIPGATKQAYVATTADIGYRLRAVVSGANVYGSGSVTTNLSATNIVAAGPKPALTVAPVLSGYAFEGSALRTTTGTWSSSTSLKFSYGWQRCDSKGNRCATIRAASAPVYTVSPGDVGGTIRAQVTATGSTGSVTATTRQSAVVAAARTGVTRLPDGTSAIAAADVSLPERLVISSVSFSPARITSRSSFTARFRVTDTHGDVVRDALVYVVALPYGILRPAGEARTDTSGYATISLTPTLSLKLRPGAIVMFVRARKQSGSLLAGISTRRLVQVRVGR